ncbi:hypothetical protein DH86_00002574, partial [Scytalidium sp. 3C]
MQTFVTAGWENNTKRRTALVVLTGPRTKSIKIPALPKPKVSSFILLLGHLVIFSFAIPPTMAANYWESTQRRYWQFTREQLDSLRKKLEEEDQNLVQMYALPQIRHLSIYFNQQIARLGKRLGIRQQAMATAQLYIRRFYSKVEIRRTNPYLVIATAVYLACKMEECPHHIRL